MTFSILSTTPEPNQDEQNINLSDCAKRDTGGLSSIRQMIFSHAEDGSGEQRDSASSVASARFEQVAGQERVLARAIELHVDEGIFFFEGSFEARASEALDET